MDYFFFNFNCNLFLKIFKKTVDSRTKIWEYIHIRTGKETKGLRGKQTLSTEWEGNQSIARKDRRGY
jgi:hypothetical protein